MKTAIKSDFKLKTFCTKKSYPHSSVQDIRLVNSKFYQKLFVVLISFSIILIIPESPRELENICENYNSSKLCNIW